jgi:DNA polymerase III alpha subunit
MGYQIRTLDAAAAAGTPPRGDERSADVGTLPSPRTVPGITAEAPAPLPDAVSFQSTPYHAGLSLDHAAQAGVGITAGTGGTGLGGGSAFFWSDMLGNHNLTTLVQMSGSQGGVSKNLGWKDPADTPERNFREAGLDITNPKIRKFFELYQAVQDLPRHLGQHSGGMVICQGQLDSVVPLEPATMPGRVVVQWDKDDCADMGIIKVDLLGLGMLAVVEECIARVRQSYGEEVDLAHLPPDDPAVYAALQKADTVGMFQVESRAQMACLPRLRPQRFYDIVVQVAIIRPGPIVGKMVHPYLQRRLGRERVDCMHPSLEPVLRRTLGVPLFQEQLLRMAMIAAGFSGGEAEELRRAFGFKRA